MPCRKHLQTHWQVRWVGHTQYQRGTALFVGQPVMLRGLPPCSILRAPGPLVTGFPIHKPPLWHVYEGFENLMYITINASETMLAT